jgi:hypothetical protein
MKAYRRGRCAIGIPGVVLLCSLAIVTVACEICCGNADDHEHNYIVKLLSPSIDQSAYWGIGYITVSYVDTRDGLSWKSREPYQELVRYYWCNEWDSLEMFPGVNRLGIDWTSVPQIDQLVKRLESVVDSDEPIFVMAGPDRICDPEKGIQVITGTVSQGSSYLSSKSLYYLWCVYSEHENSVTFVDTAQVPPDSDIELLQYPFFDSEGRYLYYESFDAGKRFDLNTHNIDTILAGNTPIIPWNAPAIVVWNANEGLYKILDSSLSTRSQIRGDLVGVVTSAFKVSEDIILICVYLNRGTEFELETVIYELDFNAGRMTELVRGLSLITQIAGAKLAD